VSTRLFFASIWVAGTVAATSLGWTAVALVAQRVGDQPVIEQSLAVLPLNVNTSVSTEAGANGTETVSRLEAPSPSDVSATGAEDVRSVPETSPASTDLVFDLGWSGENPSIPTGLVGETPPTQGTGGTNNAPKDQRELPSTQAHVTTPGSQNGASNRSQTTAYNEPNASTNNATMSVTKVGTAAAAKGQATQQEIHANPGKAFGTAPTTLLGPAPKIVAAKLAKPPDPSITVPKKSRASTPSARTSKPPVPLIPAIPANPVPAEELVTSADLNQNPAFLAPDIIIPPAPVPVEPPLLIITAAPTPVASVGATATASPTIPASAIIITMSPAASIQPSTQVASVAPATPTFAAVSTPVNISTTTKPSPVVQQAYQLSNGTVGVHCVGSSQIVLDFALPSAGVSVRVESSGPEEVKLRFRSGGDSERSNSEFVARCRRGTPTREN
jgi:hypothetical protein